jgi:gliding motility-associated-like protein
MGSNPSLIQVRPNPISDFNLSSTNLDEFNPTVELTNISIGANSYHWNFGDGTFNTQYNPPNHTYESGNYTIVLTVENQFGCIDSSYQSINIDPVFTFYIPNSISPNGDGINDIFYGKGTGYTEVTMHIFDRWGLEIFNETSELGPSDIRPYWNGNLKGVECPIDVYVYQFFVKDIFGRSHLYRGHVALIR